MAFGPVARERPHKPGVMGTRRAPQVINTDLTNARNPSAVVQSRIQTATGRESPRAEVGTPPFPFLFLFPSSPSSGERRGWVRVPGEVAGESPEQGGGVRPAERGRRGPPERVSEAASGA